MAHLHLLPGKNALRSSAALLLAFTLVFAHPLSALASTAHWQKGASIIPRWDTDFDSESFRESLRNLRSTNADFVTLIVPYYQTNIHTTDIMRGGNTPTDEALISAINYAHSIGLKVNLKPHLESFDGDWRANINPADRAAWFEAYGNMLYHYAHIAESHGVAQMTIGTELEKMTSPHSNPTNTENWRAIIRGIRRIYSGMLTYSAQYNNPNEKVHIQFWDELDSIGLSGYHPLAPHADNPSVEARMQSWDEWNRNELQPLVDQWGLPILLTEIGYKSVDGAHKEPFAWWRDGNFNDEEQAQNYEALFRYWVTQANFAGVHFWDWLSDPHAGGQGNTDYTPQGKTAEQIMREWFEGNGGDPPEPPNGSEKSFAFLAEETHGNVSDDLVIPVTVKNNESSTIENVIVDIEIFDQQNNRIFQHFFEAQSFAAGQERIYELHWTPGQAGNFHVVGGIFQAGWSSTIFWESNAGSVTITSGESGEPPQDGAFHVTAALQTVDPKVSQTAAGSVTVRNLQSTPVQNAIVDIEIYNPQNERIHQRIFANESFTANQSRVFPFEFLPQSIGNFVVRTGIFRSDWGQLFHWEHNALTFAVVASNGTQPPGAGTIDVWWVADGATVSGLQPFKVILQGKDVTEYDMFWQVDGNGLNQMFNSFEDYPHKTAWVDLSPWTWKGNDATFTITYIAKDFQGNELARRSVTMRVIHH